MGARLKITSCYRGVALQLILKGGELRGHFPHRGQFSQHKIIRSYLLRKMIRILHFVEVKV